MYKLGLCDIHCHIMEPSSLIPERDFVMPTLENAKNILRLKKELNLDLLNIPAITLYKEEDLVCNPLALYAKFLAQKEQEKVFALAGVKRYREYGKNTDMLLQAKQLMACGFDGFKMICKPNARRELLFAMNDPIFDEFYEMAEREQWPILFHVGDPETFWKKEEVPEWAIESGWFYGEDERIPSYEGLYEEIEDVLKKFPMLNMTFAHFFFLSGNLEKAQQILDKYPNVKFDVTPGSEMYENFSRNRDAARTFFIRNKGRVMFGTDTVSTLDCLVGKEISAAKTKVNGMRRFFETDDEFVFEHIPVKGLKLDMDTCKALYSGTAEMFLGKKDPKMVSLPETEKLIDSYLAMLDGEKDTWKRTGNLLEQIKNEMKEKTL